MSKALRYILLMFSFLIFFAGKIYSYNLLLCAVILLWIHNIIYSLEKLNVRVFFGSFNLAIFFFLIGRPTISMFRGNVWWYYSRESVNFALNSLMLTLLFLFIGECLFECMSEKHLHLMPKKCDFNESDFIVAFRNVSLVFFYFSSVFDLAVGIEKVIYMRGKDYLEFYTSLETNLPWIVTIVSSMCRYFLFIFLSTLPRKSLTFPPLMIYIFLSVPDLLIGIRNPFVSNAIFVFLYYFIRDVIKSKEKWLGFFEKFSITTLTPIVVIILGAYNYIRDKAGGAKVNKGIFDLLVDFIYKQGVSFEVLCMGYEAIPKIKYTGFVNYTFGGIIDYFKYSKMAQLFWGGTSLGYGNNIVRALYSNNFAHRMSYTVLGGEYLKGHGLGSSYILETFVDFGYLGVIIFSVLLGMLLASMIYIIKGSNMGRMFVLIFLSTIYFCPRDGATSWLNFVFHIYFLFPLFICYVLAKLMVKKYQYCDLRGSGDFIVN